MPRFNRFKIVSAAPQVPAQVNHRGTSTSNYSDVDRSDQWDLGRRLFFDEYGDIINPDKLGIPAPEIIPECISSFYVRTNVLDSRLYNARGARYQAAQTQHPPREFKDFRVDMRRGRPFNVDCILRWIMFEDNQQICASVEMVGELDNGRLILRQSRPCMFNCLMWFADDTIAHMFYEYMLHGRQIFTNYSISLLLNIVRDGITFRADLLLSYDEQGNYAHCYVVLRGSGQPHYIQGSYDFNTRQILIQGAVQGYGMRLIFNIANNTEDSRHERVGYEIVPEGRGFASFISDLRDVVDGKNNNDDPAPRFAMPDDKNDVCGICFQNKPIGDGSGLYDERLAAHYCAECLANWVRSQPRPTNPMSPSDFIHVHNARMIMTMDEAMRQQNHTTDLPSTDHLQN
jgi:hypothetical protein